MISADRPATRLATRLAFLVAGFGVACWAPLIPYAKARLAVDDGVLGLLLLCLGIGSVIAMPLTGMLSARYGSKPIIIAGAIGMAVAYGLDHEAALRSITLSAAEILGISESNVSTKIGRLKQRLRDEL